jgi:beta-lactamase class A
MFLGDTMKTVSHMAGITLALVAACATIAVHGQSKPDAQNIGIEQLRSQIQGIRGAFPGNMAVYMKNLQTGEEIALDADSVYETFSVIKIPIMAEVFHQAESGKFSLDQRVELTPGDQRLPSGVLYTMQPGLKPTIRDLLTLMIIISDNEATDLLADKVTRPSVTSYMHQLGLANTSIEFSDLDWDRKWLGSLDAGYRNAPGNKTLEFPFDKYSGSEVQHAFGETIYNAGIYFGHSTPREVGRLLEMIQQKKLVSVGASEWMLATLEKQQVDNRFPKYLRDVVIAHKTGDGQPFLANDAGIIFIRNQPVVLVVFTGHHRGDTESLHDAVARVAALVGQHYGARLSSDYKPR